MLHQVEQALEEHLVDQVEPAHARLHLPDLDRHMVHLGEVVLVVVVKVVEVVVAPLASPEEGEAVVADECLGGSDQEGPVAQGRGGLQQLLRRAGGGGHS